MSLSVSIEIAGAIVFSRISSGRTLLELYRLNSLTQSSLSLNDSGAIHAEPKSDHPAGEGAPKTSCPIDFNAGNKSCRFGRSTFPPE